MQEHLINFLNEGTYRRATVLYYTTTFDPRADELIRKLISMKTAAEPKYIHCALLLWGSSYMEDIVLELGLDGQMYSVDPDVIRQICDVSDDFTTVSSNVTISDITSTLYNLRPLEVGKLRRSLNSDTGLYSPDAYSCTHPACMLQNLDSHELFLVDDLEKAMNDLPHKVSVRQMLEEHDANLYSAHSLLGMD